MISGEIDIRWESGGNVRICHKFASLVYTGNGYTGNKALIEWARANGIPWTAGTTRKAMGFAGVRDLSDRPGGRAAQNPMAD